MPGATKNIGGGPANGATSNLPLWGSPEQQAADPLHLFPGNPGPNPNAPPSQLPNFGIQPRYYNPNSFTAPSKAGGQWNEMAQKLAGPMYKPTLMPAPKPGQVAPGGMAPGVMAPGGSSGGSSILGQIMGFLNPNPTNSGAANNPFNPMGNFNPIKKIGGFF